MREIMKMGMLASCIMISAIVAGDVLVRAEDSPAGTGNASRPCGAYCAGIQGRRRETQISREQLEKYHQQDALQRRANQAAEEMRNLLSWNAEVKVVYGGMYIGAGEREGDEDVLVVVLTTDSEEIKEMVQRGTPSQNVRFQKGKYTYDELQEIADQIADAYGKSPMARRLQSFSVGVYESQNVVMVTLPDLAYVDWFKREICDADCVVFREGTIVPVAGVRSQEVGTTWNVKNIRYTISKKTGKIREVKVRGVDDKTRRSVTIPASIKLNKVSYKVVGIGKNAFKGMKKLKKVTIGKNVRKIDRRAINNCKKLKTVKILSKKCSYSVKSIRKGASKKVVIKVPKGAREK